MRNKLKNLSSTSKAIGMFSWLKNFKDSTAQTKYLVIVTAIFCICLAVTTIYSYVRLDFVRSYKTEPPSTQQKK